MIPYGHQSVSEGDIAAVTEVLRGDWLTQGPAIERFEEAVAEYCGARFAVAVCNGTAALHAAAHAAGLGPGKRLWTSPITFVASANCARYVGADVDFVDIESGTLNMDPKALADKLERAEREGGLPDVVVPVHMCGASCDMASIRRLADHYGFSVIEDASHALGGRYLDARVGSCAYSEMSTFSLHPVKIITTGEGGLVLTDSEEVHERLTLFRNHGITRDPGRMTGECQGAWYYEQLELGYNYRMTDMQAALGASQLVRADAFVSRRNEIARRYVEAFASLPLVSQTVPEGVASAYHLYVVRVGARRRASVFAALREAGIGVNVHYIPVHLQPYYRRLGFGPGDFPEAERYYSEAISLPIYPGLSDEEQEHVIARVCLEMETR